MDSNLPTGPQLAAIVYAEARKLVDQIDSSLLDFADLGPVLCNTAWAAKGLLDYGNVIVTEALYWRLSYATEAMRIRAGAEDGGYQIQLYVRLADGWIWDPIGTAGPLASRKIRADTLRSGGSVARVVCGDRVVYVAPPMP